MSDDIVTRLRRMDASIPSVDPEMYVSPTEAADEIERLRAERLSWLNIAFCTHCLPQHDHYCAEHLQEKR